MPDPVKVPGRIIKMNGQDYVVAPLKLRQLMEREGDIDRMNPSHPEAFTTGGERLTAMARVVAASLSRNYPDMTEDRVMDLLDMGNYNQAFNAALAVSGLEPGEAEAVKGSASSGSSTALLPPTDGLTERSDALH